MPRRMPPLAALVTAGAFALPLAAQADTSCTTVGVDFVPSSDQLQMVAWLEDTSGNYVDTIYITQKTGHYGLGNRPGRFDFNSGPTGHDLWPYGRRITVFPIWAHRHGMTFPEVDYQDGADSDLSHSFMQSSIEADPPYCRPMLDSEPAWDTGTCASEYSYTDKGELSSTATSLYPPRADLTPGGGMDSPSVSMYAALDPFDAVSQATPPGGATAAITWTKPSTIPTGDYVLWVEVSRAFDFNGTYNSTVYPSPQVAYGNYGEPYRGQPSIVYRIPVTIGASETTASATDYFGYGDPTGADGVVRPPDDTITSDTPGSGASRLQLLPAGTGRIAVDIIPQTDNIAPAMPGSMQSVAVTSQSATVSFVAPGNDGLVGQVAGYDVRVQVGTPITSDNFANAMPIAAAVTPAPSGQVQTVEIDGLLPETNYYIGVQAYDDCHNTSPLAVLEVKTADRQAGEVDACFIATAAYGSVMANDVGMLRHMRDSLLKSSVLGELAIETYYTFGPAVAGVVGQSELLRETARDALRPIVRWARGASY